MKKAVYRVILFAAVTVFVLSLSPRVMAEPNDTGTKCVAADTTAVCNADKPEPAVSPKPAVNKENSQLQLAKEQLRGDFYKESQDNLKSALYTLFAITIAVILSAFGVIAYFVFKDKRDYKDAVADAKDAARDAKDAAKNAHDLEKEAQGVLTDIKKQAVTTIEEIKETSKKQKDESTKEFERQREISELFNKGLTASKVKDYETTADCYRQIVEGLKEENNHVVYYNWGTALLELVRSKKGQQTEKLFDQAIEKFQKAIKIKPDYSDAYGNWGTALTGLAKLKDGPQAEELLNQAIEKYESATNIKPDNHKVYDNWGTTLSDLAGRKEGEEANKLFGEACEKHEKAIEIKPDDWVAYNNWGAALIYLAKLKKGKEKENLLQQAEEKFLRAESMKTGISAYNLGCIYALRGNEEKCQEWLKVGEKAGTLPTREHAMGDDDLKSVWEEEWFKKLRWEGE